MEKKNYYRILGINTAANIDEVLHAYRNLAKKYHPDLTGDRDASRFHDITEAYEVLSNPIKRNKYDKLLREEQKCRQALRSRVEPLDPYRSRSRKRIRVAGVDSFFNYSSCTKPAEPLSDVLKVNLVLTKEEALRGGFFHVSVPAFVVCPVCKCRGTDWFFPCMYCRGLGRLKEIIDIKSSFPAHIRHGDKLEVKIIMEGSVLLVRFNVQITDS